MDTIHILRVPKGIDHVNNPEEIWIETHRSSINVLSVQETIKAFEFEFVITTHPLAVPSPAGGLWWRPFVAESIPIPPAAVRTWGYKEGPVGRWEMRPILQSQNAPVPYPTMLHSEQKCAHFCSEWSTVGYGRGAFWDSWIRSIEHMDHDGQYIRNLTDDLEFKNLLESDRSSSIDQDEQVLAYYDIFIGFVSTSIQHRRHIFHSNTHPYT